MTLCQVKKVPWKALVGLFLKLNHFHGDVKRSIVSLKNYRTKAKRKPSRQSTQQTLAGDTSSRPKPINFPSDFWGFELN